MMSTVIKSVDGAIKVHLHVAYIYTVDVIQYTAAMCVYIVVHIICIAIRKDASSLRDYVALYRQVNQQSSGKEDYRR